MKKEKKVQVAAEKTKPTTAEIKAQAAEIVEDYRKELSPKIFAELERRMAAARKKRKKPLTADNIRQIFVGMGDYYFTSRKSEPGKPVAKKIRKKMTAKERTTDKEVSRKDGNITKMSSAADMKKVIARIKTESPELANFLELLQEAGIIKGGVIWEAPELKKDPELEQLLDSLHSNYEHFVTHAEHGKKLWRQEVLRTVAETDPDVDKFFRGKPIDPMSVRQLLDPHFMNEEFAGKLLKVKKALVAKRLMVDWEEMPDIKTSANKEAEKAAMKAARDRFSGMQAGMAACDLQNPFMKDTSTGKESPCSEYIDPTFPSIGSVRAFLSRIHISLKKTDKVEQELIKVIKTLRDSVKPVMKNPSIKVFPEDTLTTRPILPEDASALAKALSTIEDSIDDSTLRLENCIVAARTLISQINL